MLAAIFLVIFGILGFLLLQQDGIRPILGGVILAVVIIIGILALIANSGHGDPPRTIDRR